LAIVYHIHKKGDFNLKDGYIGFSTRNDITKRIKEHKIKGSRLYSYFSDPTLDLEYRVLFRGSEKDMLEKEFQLRPENNIGWNIAKGGGLPPKTTKESAKKILQSKRDSGYFEDGRSRKAALKSARTMKANGFYKSEKHMESLEKARQVNLNKNPKINLPVDMLDMDNDTVIRTFNNSREASKYLINKSTTTPKNLKSTLNETKRQIVKCCEGKGKTCRKYKWKYSKRSTTSA
jgi:hypothetical protein